MPNAIHISARPDDLPSLTESMIAFAHDPAHKLDSVITTALLAFGFVYVRPFEYGNGRIHHYLMHLLLAQRGLDPPGVVFRR